MSLANARKNVPALWAYVTKQALMAIPKRDWTSSLTNRSSFASNMIKPSRITHAYKKFSNLKLKLTLVIMLTNLASIYDI